MGLDWRTLDLSAYLEALEANNAAHDGDKTAPEPSERLKRAVRAHMGGGKS